MKKLVSCLALSLCAPQIAAAHPHIFIQAGVDLMINDQGQLTQIKVTWSYDSFYSLLLTSDLGMDKDGDGQLTAEEEAKLAGFDANWIEGFNGDLVARLGGQELKLSGPNEPTAQMIDGHIVSTHLRDVEGTPAIGGDPLSVKVFDWTYYTAYELTLPTQIKGHQGCDMTLIEPNIDAELSRMQTMLLGIDANADLEEADIPFLGEAFATDILVTCPAS